jgi:hypothetical protein
MVALNVAQNNTETLCIRTATDGLADFVRFQQCPSSPDPGRSAALTQCAGNTSAIAVAALKEHKTVTRERHSLAGPTVQEA